MYVGELKAGTVTKSARVVTDAMNRIMARAQATPALLFLCSPPAVQDTGWHSGVERQLKEDRRFRQQAARALSVVSEFCDIYRERPNACLRASDSA